MKLNVRKSRLRGRVAIPASKSHTIRAVAIASLAEGTSIIRKPLTSSDTASAVACYRALGARIDTTRQDIWKVTGVGGKVSAPADTIDVGNSGTTLRIALGSAALLPAGRLATFTGDEQIQARPLGPLMDSLADLGAKCTSLNNNAKAPVEVQGQLTGGKTTIECKTSQYLSSLLLCTPLAKGDSEIEVTLLNEPGYVQMTLDWLDRQGIKYENKEMRQFKIKGGQSYRAFDENICGDFSSATFFLCAAALCGDEVTLTGLDFADSQPDKAVLDYLRQMGADIEITTDSVTVEAAELKGAELDLNATPDALPAMAVTAAFAKGTTKLFNVPQARSKETDRIKCMAAELKKMGIEVEELADGLIINGGQPGPTEFNGYGDHRIVMALAVAGLNIDGECKINTAEAMNVTFPGFVELMQGIGANIKLTR